MQRASGGTPVDLLHPWMIKFVKTLPADVHCICKTYFQLERLIYFLLLPFPTNNPHSKSVIFGLTGGAFYTPETIDTARLHYRNSWAPILHAVALWLNSTGFTGPEKEDASALVPNPQKRATSIMLNPTPGTPQISKSLQEINKDRMHLILGNILHVLSEF